MGKLAHVGLTVKNMEKAIAFYGDILGLKKTGDMFMEGPEVDKLTQIKNAKLRVVYFNSQEDPGAPPIELLEFVGDDDTREPYDRLTHPGIAEVCFSVTDIDEVYEELKARGVDFLSEPHLFDLTDQGYGKSKAVYFKDQDGSILELIQPVE